VARIYHFPKDLEQIISHRAREEGGDAPAAALAAAIRELSDLFNGKTPWSPEYHRDPRFRHAYVGYYLPVNLPKPRVPLEAWLAPRPRVWAGRPLRALDLGSGPGTALLGLADLVRDLPGDARPSSLDLVATDLSPENLRSAERLLADFAAVEPRLPPIRFQGLRTDLVADRSGLFPIATAGGRFDLVLAANVVCELVRESPDGLDRAVALVEAVAADALAPGGAIVLLEPGLKETSRNFHRLRDRVLGSGSREGGSAPGRGAARTEGASRAEEALRTDGGSREGPGTGTGPDGEAGPPKVRPLYVHAPCLHQEGCPALATRRDWCYAELDWDPPALVADLDRRTGLRKDTLRFAYLLLSPEPPPAPLTARSRLVSEVIELKGERRMHLCAAGRWTVLGQLRRERGGNDEVLRALRRGDLVEVEGAERRGSLDRLPASGTIRRIDESPF
jgi:SAM-dependent methyltransferase